MRPRHTRRRQARRRPTPPSTVALTIACIAGVVHAAWSFYWALGGPWLLPTVGHWAVEAAESAPIASAVLLGGIGLIKLLAALIPLLVAGDVMPWPRFWRAVCWVGGLVLVVYGGVNVVVSGAVLLGVIRPDGGYDEEAMIGHALIWDPLFAVWGAALIVWLRLSRVRIEAAPVELSERREAI